MDRRNGSTLREFIQNYKTDNPDDYREINQEISAEYETTAYSVLRNDSNSMLMFNCLSGYRDFRLLTNVLGSERRIFYGTGTSDLRSFNERYARALSEYPSGSVTFQKGSATFMERVMRDDSVDLYSIPVPSHYPSDGSKAGKSRYISSGIVAHRTLENPEIINLSFTRIQPISKNMYAFDAGSHGHLWNYLNHASQKGEEVELTVMIGVHPLYYLLAASFTDREYDRASTFMDVELSRGLENDIYLPHDAEIVLEARFKPGKNFDEGPFAEYTGYMGHDSTRYTAQVKSILMRNDPIYYDIQPSNSSEHVNTFSMPRSAGIMGTLRDYMPRGTDFSVVWPHSGARFLSLGYVVPPSRGLARQLGLGIMALDPLWGKFIIINQGVAALDFTSTLARLINTGEDYGEVFTRIPGVFVISSDFTAGKDGTTGKIIAVTDSSDEEFTTSISGRDLIVRAGKGEAVISHSYRNDRRINIIVGEDIDATDPEQVQWAVSTRVNPHTDVEISRNSIVIRADRVTPEVPALDKSAVERIRRLFPDSEASGS